MGSDKAQDEDAFDDEQPPRELSLPDYWIARWPVTNAQFRAFVEASGYREHDKRAEQGPESRPVAYVTWHDASAYCAWLDSRLRELANPKSQLAGLSNDESDLYGGIAAGKLQVNLPSEPEWEKAARGTDARPFPWGDAADTDRANYAMDVGEASVVGCYPLGASPYGCEDMSGNVREWTRSLYADYPYPDARQALREREDPESDRPRVLRGGAFLYGGNDVRCAYRGLGDSGARYGGVGFRVVLSPFPLDSGPSGL